MIFLGWRAGGCVVSGYMFKTRTAVDVFMSVN